MKRMKKLKKLVAVMMAAAMMLALVACGSSSDGAKEGATTAKEEVAASDLKVGFIFLHDENSTYDLNFINAAKEACEAAGVEYVLKTKYSDYFYSKSIRILWFTQFYKNIQRFNCEFG